MLKYLKIGKTYVKIDGENDFKSFTYNIERVRVVGENQPLFLSFFILNVKKREKRRIRRAPFLLPVLRKRRFI